MLKYIKNTFIFELFQKVCVSHNWDEQFFKRRKFHLTKEINLFWKEIEKDLFFDQMLKW